VAFTSHSLSVYGLHITPLFSHLHTHSLVHLICGLLVWLDLTFFAFTSARFVQDVPSFAWLLPAFTYITPRAPHLKTAVYTLSRYASLTTFPARYGPRILRYDAPRGSSLLTHAVSGCLIGFTFRRVTFWFTLVCTHLFYSRSFTPRFA